MEGKLLELKKKNYSAKEVSKIVENLTKENEQKLAEQRARIEELVLENNKLCATLKEYTKKEDFINNALIKAEQQASDTLLKAKMQYSLTIEKLKTFYDRWNAYFNRLYEKYPHYEEVSKANELKEKLKVILYGSQTQSVNIVDELEKDLPREENGGVFNPQSKINEYVAATSTNGFNLEEVLNPGELELEDICKELGLIDEEE